MALSDSWLRVQPFRLTFHSFLWLLCTLPMLQVMLFPSIQERLSTPLGFAVQSLRPLSSLGALFVIASLAHRQQGRRRWAWRCITVALLLNTVFSIDRIIAGTAEPTPLTKTLPLLIYLFALAGTALYIEPHAWWLGSTARTILDGIAVGYACLVLLHTSLPLLLHRWPWNPQVGIVLPYLALDMGILFAVGAGGLRFGHGNRLFVVFILLSLLCLIIADVFYLVLAWMPWGQGKHWLLQPLFSLQAILLAFAAYRDVCSPMTSPVQPVPMPLREWLVWGIVPEFFLFSALFVASLVGPMSPSMLCALFGIALMHTFLAEHDSRRVLGNLSLAREQVRQSNSALTAANTELEAANHRLAQANRDLAIAHIIAQTAAARSEAFIARVIHDLAPPVQGLMSILSDARWRISPPLGYDVVIRQLRLLETFIQQARTYLHARAVPLHGRLLPLLPVCHTAISTIALHARRRDITVCQEIEVEAPIIWGDEVALLRILDNLLMNALGVTPDGGMVIVRVTAPAPAWVEVAIVDQGPGIPIDKQAILFQPYVSMQLTSLEQQGGLAPSPTGTGMGLGLAIVKELTTALGGVCGVRSSPGAGSTFYIRLTEEPLNGQAKSRPTDDSGD